MFNSDRLNTLKQKIIEKYNSVKNKIGDPEFRNSVAKFISAFVAFSAACGYLYLLSFEGKDFVYKFNKKALGAENIDVGQYSTSVIRTRVIKIKEARADATDKFYQLKTLLREIDGQMKRLQKHATGLSKQKTMLMLTFDDSVGEANKALGELVKQSNEQINALSNIGKSLSGSNAKKQLSKISHLKRLKKMTEIFYGRIKPISTPALDNQHARINKNVQNLVNEGNINKAIELLDEYRERLIGVMKKKNL